MNGSRSVVIRPMQATDTADIVRWRNDPAVLAQFFGAEPPTPASHIRWFENMLKRGDRQEFIIVTQPEQRPIGVVNLSNIDLQNLRAEYGILIGESDARGSGYAFAASELILERAFQDLKLNRLYLYVFVDNFAAIKLYTRLGFQIEGTLRQYICKRGLFYDVYEMAILADEWRR